MPVSPQRFELAARRALEDRRHVVDSARQQGGLGLVERLEHLGRGLPCRINTETYSITSTSPPREGIEYVIMDDGWAARHGESLLRSIRTSIYGESSTMPHRKT